MTSILIEFGFQEQREDPRVEKTLDAIFKLAGFELMLITHAEY